MLNKSSFGTNSQKCDAKKGYESCPNSNDIKKMLGDPEFST